MRRAALALPALYLVCSGHIGHCTHEEDPLALPPPHARAQILELAAGTVEARVEVFSTATDPTTPLFVPAAVVDGGPAAFELVPDASGDLVGRAAGYEAVDYTVSFVLDDSQWAQGGTYALSMHGPATRPNAWWDDAVTVGWEPAALAVYVEVLDDLGERIWSNLGSRLPTGGLVVLPVEVAAAAAEVRICGAEASRRELPGARPLHDAGAVSSALGSRSVMVVGRCVTL